ncbi:fatty acid-binding protein 1 [Helicoverpa armigera]|uniref:fatty acid-binding protein 1 n=1 Tax=Helicoverpa armigera TaxID=29058 RepID=UPI0021123EDC|nr:fatty acid-binding protein 1 [Helicoverpa armigera]
MAFFGKEYKFEKQENFEDFVNALGLTPEQTQGYLTYTPTLKFTQDGDSYTVTTITPKTKSEVTFKSGVEFDENNANRHCKTTYTVAGDTITQVQKYDDGNSLTITRKFSGNEMVVTLATSKWDGVARRYYKA